MFLLRSPFRSSGLLVCYIRSISVEYIVHSLGEVGIYVYKYHNIPAVGVLLTTWTPVAPTNAEGGHVCVFPRRSVRDRWSVARAAERLRALRGGLHRRGVVRDFGVHHASYQVCYAVDGQRAGYLEAGKEGYEFMYLYRARCAEIYIAYIFCLSCFCHIFPFDTEISLWSMHRADVLLMELYQ